MAVAVLVGLPGTGKTTTGRALALAVGLSFVDTDDLFARLEGVSVQEYLRSHPESQFRQRECVVLAAALRDYGVVATGGGVVTSAEAREALVGEPTVWLDCEDAVIMARVADGDRPLLGDDPAQALARLRAKRAELYREVSRRRLDTDRPTAEVVDELVGFVASRESS